MATATATPLRCDPVAAVLERAAGLQAALGRLVVDEVAVGRAREVVEALARCERAVAATRVRLARRVAGAGLFGVEGDRDAASYLSRVSGCSPARARGELSLAERLERLPGVREAFGAGRLSTEQAQVVAAAAAANPSAAEDLVAVAERGSFAELRGAAAAAERAARTEDDEVARERRVHARRYCRTWAPPGGGLRLDAWVSAVDGARLAACLAKKTAELMADAREPAERLRADALVALVGGEQVRTEVFVRVDAAALARGEARPGEVCEVPGLGPVSVTAARSLLGEAFLTLLVTRGADVATVTSTTRTVPRKVRLALSERDRRCVVPGCGATHFLQIDHWRLDFARGGMTELDNLCRLCSVHHRMKTEGGWRLLGGPGRWRWVSPRAGP